MSDTLRGDVVFCCQPEVVRPAPPISIERLNWLTFIYRTSIDRLGVEFPYHGDTVIWLWPWRRDGKPKFISVGFTGTGEGGDVRFDTLREIDARWRACSDALKTENEAYG